LANAESDLAKVPTVVDKGFERAFLRCRRLLNHGEEKPLKGNGVLAVVMSEMTSRRCV